MRKDVIKTATGYQRKDPDDNFIISYEPTIEIIEKDSRTKIEAENRGQAILDDASISEVEHAVED